MPNLHSAAGQRMLSILRIVVGLLFMEHGTQKLFAFPAPLMPGFHLTLMSELGVAGVLEAVGGLFILAGLLTRPVAFVLAGEMAVAYFQQHFPKSFFPVVNQGEPAVLFCFIFLLFAAAGGGAWSIDAIISRGRSERISEPTTVDSRRNDLEVRRRRAV